MSYLRINISHLPKEISDIKEEVRKLYNAFGSVINYILNHFETTKNNYLKHHAEQINRWNEGHYINKDNFLSLDKTIKMNVSLLSKWKKKVGEEYHKFIQSLTEILHDVAQHLNLQTEYTSSYMMTQDLTGVIQMSKRVGKMNKFHAIIQIKIENLNKHLRNFDSFNSNLLSSLIMYPGIKLTPISIEELLLEMDKYKVEGLTNINYNIVLNHVNKLVKRGLIPTHPSDLENFKFTFNENYFKELLERRGRPVSNRPIKRRRRISSSELDDSNNDTNTDPVNNISSPNTNNPNDNTINNSSSANTNNTNDNTANDKSSPNISITDNSRPNSNITNTTPQTSNNANNASSQNSNHPNGLPIEDMDIVD